jgi:LEA14-like dessication related protein
VTFRFYTTTCFLVAAIVVQTGCRPPKMLEFKKVSNFKLGSVGLEKSSVSLDAIFYNPNKFSLKLKEAMLEVYVDDRYSGKLSLINSVEKIPRAGEFILPIHVEAENKSLLTDGLSLLFHRSIEVKVKGKLKAGNRGIFITVPVNYTSRESF